MISLCVWEHLWLFLGMVISYFSGKKCLVAGLLFVPICIGHSWKLRAVAKRTEKSQMPTSIFITCKIYYRPQRSYGKEVFSRVSVILSTGGGLSGRHPPWGDTPSGQNTPPARHPPHPGRQPPPQQTAAAADGGTHPTGMHSCDTCTFSSISNFLPKTFVIKFHSRQVW